MQRFMILCHRRVAILASIFAALFIACPGMGAQDQTGDKIPDQSQAAPSLRVESNLVVVRAVVRDAQGHPIKGLKKEDFRLFDRGKPQTIAQFEEVSPAEAPAGPAAAAIPGQPAPPPAAAPPERFLAFYFDNLNTSAADLMQGRDAADRLLTTGLRPEDRVAIFTADAMLSDFTADAGQIREALNKIHPSPRAPVRGMECPNLSDYQAMELLRTNDLESNAWREVIAEAKTCQVSAFAVGASSVPGIPPQMLTMIRNLAHRVVDQSELGARSNLQQFEQVVKFVSKLPGQRTVILVSPGFLPENWQVQLDRIIDNALRSQVVIDSLNPTGLAVTQRENDASRGDTTGGNAKATEAMHNLDAQRTFASADPLAEVAEGTGGEFIHDNNDLKAGFAALAEQPAHYILAFTPQEIKRDGKFHPLKVTLAEGRKGYSVQARRGYFVPTEQAGAQAQDVEPEESPEAREEELIREALRSKTDRDDLPVDLKMSSSAGTGEMRELSLVTHLDVKPLHFRKDGDHNLNNVAFTLAVFDQKDNLVLVKERHARINVVDPQLPDFFMTGIDVETAFELKPGSYRVRVVVTDAEEHRMAAFSRPAEVQ